ncbi:YlbE-like family protein [Fervidibacillus albus]|uniref:YlbE-like family protein n=1 Tax=Fervidibacillus albus TaxID=2980026 RepID=A0A9E8RYG5_9BACI|nr:YlbE-like family protein [Fervidibacillus albus]WAA10607.1 YlbE-like family protein [Fervidibacillus albus]
MRRELLTRIQADRDLHRFLREQPKWYRTLSRDPETFTEFQRSAKQYYKKTFPDRIRKLSEGAQMASFMFNMLQSLQNEQE